MTRASPKHESAVDLLSRTLAYLPPELAEEVLNYIKERDHAEEGPDR